MSAGASEGKRLHPADIFLTAGTLLRHMGLLILLWLFQAGDESAAFTIGTVALALLFVLTTSVVTWWRFRFFVEGPHFVITSGLFQLKRREIPLSKIQDLAFERNALHRMLGLVAVSIQTSGTAGAEGALSAVSLADAEELKAQLVGATAISLTAESPLASKETTTPTMDPPIVRVGTRNLLLRGLTDNRAGFLIAGALGVFHEALEAQRGLVEGFARYISVRLNSAGAVAGATVVVAAFLIVWILGYLSSSIFNLVSFYGLELRERDGTFHRRFGLITLKAHSLPRGRIQALTIHQSFLRRIVGIASMQVRDMGGGQDKKENQRVGSDTFVPAARLATMAAVRRAVFPNVPEATWKSVSRRLIRRSAAGAFIASSPAFFFALWGPQIRALGAVPFVAAAAGVVYGVMRHRVLAYDFSQNYIAIRDGVFGRAWTDIPLERVQAIRLDRSPLDRWHGVATLRIVVGGGHAFSVPNVELEAAGAMAELVHTALPAAEFEEPAEDGAESPSVPVPI